ncbi:MAG: hypothetical protein B6D59_06360 [Campylobacteraceae bacterium 4484_4]|nr:MAG: hypothetical protein B6D59_06360 [Campylobacteraceae bacterium 4484_4]
MKFILKELTIFLGILILLSLGVHFKEWMDHPAEHFTSLPHSSLGLWHPLFLSFGLYLIIAVLRFLFGLFGKFFRKGV